MFFSGYIKYLLKVREFQDTRTLLFDGESGLRSKSVQRDILKQLKITVHAEPLWKRAMAERAIREIKLRMAVHLDFEGNTLTFGFFFFFLILVLYIMIIFFF